MSQGSGQVMSAGPGLTPVKQARPSPVGWRSRALPGGAVCPQATLASH